MLDQESDLASGPSLATACLADLGHGFPHLFLPLQWKITHSLPHEGVVGLKIVHRLCACPSVATGAKNGLPLRVTLGPAHSWGARKYTVFVGEGGRHRRDWMWGNGPGAMDEAFRIQTQTLVLPSLPVSYVRVLPLQAHSPPVCLCRILDTDLYVKAAPTAAPSGVPLLFPQSPC